MRGILTTPGGPVRRLYAILAGVAVLSGSLACAAPAGGGGEHLVTVSAGDHDRRAVPLRFQLPAELATAEPLRLQAEDGSLVAVQADGEGAAYFILPSAAAGEEVRFTLQRGEAGAPPVEASREGESVTLSVDRNPVLSYHGAPTPLPRPDIDPVYGRGGYIHPVRTPAGVVVTGDYPPDHVHHHGIWASWTRTRFQGQQVDFWNVADGQGDVLADGVDTTWSGVVHGGFSAAHRYVSLVGEEPVDALNEVWMGRVYNVSGDGRPYWLFDLEIEQTTAGDEPLVLPTYHYGGVALRGRDDWYGAANAAFLTSEGHDRIAGNETRARWTHLGGTADGGERGIAVFSHPDNFTHPEPVRLHPNEPYFSFTPSQLGEWAIEPGEVHRVRYRYLVHDGPVDPAELERVWVDFAQPPEVTVRMP